MGEFTYKMSDLKDVRRFAAERLTRRCVTLSTAGDHMILHLPRSKTDYDNTGVDIVVATAADDACPIHYMDILLQQELKEDGQPFFRLSNGAFTCDRVLKLLADRLHRCGRSSEGFRGHSFRKGAAQHAYNQHLS
ncbi:hypothetical protein K469DRAFT_791696 [Zopfia rhizophila CBS 207.26]|uniref:Tyr recombinase domain-containing protein n=1 Tax=Zopfia rhizophila CBS 207.26 TaxID=1314779 RepID=A0A6A6DUP3_9PEZI|nr:hypothetical protein K469DRAFT_791696 [Zopfia rhizophila CBS 207.26]